MRRCAPGGARRAQHADPGLAAPRPHDPPFPTRPRPQLRGHEARLAALVDALATSHHAGFARSIQNYSRILQLFGEAGAQIDGLKKSLSDAHRQLAVQSRHLHQQVRQGRLRGPGGRGSGPGVACAGCMVAAACAEARSAWDPTPALLRSGARA